MAKQMREAYCVYCGRPVYGMTDKHALYLKEAHEAACPLKTKGASTTSETSSRPSLLDIKGDQDGKSKN